MKSHSPSYQVHASIITVNYNGLHYLENFIPAILSSQGTFELIIADNGSQDGSPGYINSHFPSVRVLPISRNIGFSAANNQAAQLAESELLVFINPDTRVDPDWLPRLLEPFDDPTVGLTTAKILLLSDPEKINTCGNSVHISGLTLCRGLGEPRGDYSKSEEVAAVSGAAFAIRRSLFSFLGGFDEEYFMYMEETDLSCRARLAGWRCITAPGSIVWHDYSLRFGPEKVFFQERNRYRTLLKSLRWPTLFILSPVFLLAEIITWGFVLGNDRPNWRNKLRAYAQTVRRFREILHQRREAQAKRRIPDRELLRLTGSSLEFSQVTRSRAARIAAIVFNPIFFLLRAVIFLVVWW